MRESVFNTTRQPKSSVKAVLFDNLEILSLRSNKSKLYWRVPLWSVDLRRGRPLNATAGAQLRDFPGVRLHFLVQIKLALLQN